MTGAPSCRTQNTADLANGFIVNVPVTFEFSKQLRVNINFGTQYYTVAIRTGCTPLLVQASPGRSFGTGVLFPKYWL